MGGRSRAAIKYLAHAEKYKFSKLLKVQQLVDGMRGDFSGNFGKAPGNSLPCTSYACRGLY